MAESAGKYSKPAATFVSILLHAGTNAHFLHLQTKSYAQHVALGDFYQSIIELADTWAEAYQGCYEVIDSYPADNFHLAKEPVKYLGQLSDFVGKIRKTLPDETQLQNIVDEIAALIDSTLYKLRFLS